MRHKPRRLFSISQAHLDNLDHLRAHYPRPNGKPLSATGMLEWLIEMGMWEAIGSAIETDTIGGQAVYTTAPTVKAFKRHETKHGPWLRVKFGEMWQQAIGEISKDGDLVLANYWGPKGMWNGHANVDWSLKWQWSNDEGIPVGV